MGKLVKFASQIDEQTLKELRSVAQETDRSISRILTEAVNEYLSRARVRPEFREATEKVVRDHFDLLRRLAK